MPSIPCQGYCGGHYPRSEMRQAGPDGERFCKACFDAYQRQRFFG
jgi:hypothetical protein